MLLLLVRCSTLLSGVCDQLGLKVLKVEACPGQATLKVPRYGVHEQSQTNGPDTTIEDPSKVPRYLDAWCSLHYRCRYLAPEPLNLARRQHQRCGFHLALKSSLTHSLTLTLTFASSAPSTTSRVSPLPRRLLDDILHIDND